MRLKLRRTLYPMFVGLFALSLMLSACGDDGDEVAEPAIEEPAIEDAEGLEEAED